MQWQYFRKNKYIDIKDNIFYKTKAEVCNCFGYHYKLWRKGSVKHPYKENVEIWFPKLYENPDWHNDISSNEKTIYECPVDENSIESQIQSWINSDLKIRYAFVQYKPRGEYHFKGAYKLNRERTKNEKMAVWERISTKVETVKDSK